MSEKNWANCRFRSTRPSLKDCHHSDCGKLSIQKSHKAGDIPHSIALWNSSLYWYFKFWASGKLISRNQISETRRVHCLTSLQERLATPKNCHFRLCLISSASNSKYLNARETFLQNLKVIKRPLGTAVPLIPTACQRWKQPPRHLGEIWIRTFSHFTHCCTLPSLP